VKKRKLYLFSLAIFLVLLLIVAGCQPPPGVDETDADNNSNDSIGINDETVYNWTLQTSMPAGVVIHEMFEKFAEEVKVASGGRLIIEVEPGGSIVGALEVVDAVDSGILDAHGSVSTYWMGRAPALSLFTSVPMGFEPFMYLTWIYEEGGLELWQEAYDNAGFDIKVMPMGITHPEVLAHTHVPMETLEDFRGLKFRTAAEFAEIFRGMGVSVTTLPGAEVYPSLERRVIDAAEFSTPSVNHVLGFQEITEYFAGPGMHQPACMFELAINKDAWNALPEDLKQIVEISARSTTLWAWAKDFSLSLEAVESWEEMGNTPVHVDHAVQRDFREIAWEHMDTQAERDEMYNTVWTSMKEYWDRFTEYEKFMVPVRE